MSNFENLKVRSNATLAPAPEDVLPALARVLRAHNGVDYALLTYACVECGSIGQSESEAARNSNALAVDFACCTPDSSYVFVSA